MSRALVLLVPVLRACVWLVLLAVILVPLERLFALHPQKTFRKAILTDVASYFLSSLTAKSRGSTPEQKQHGIYEQIREVMPLQGSMGVERMCRLTGDSR